MSMRPNPTTDRTWAIEYDNDTGDDDGTRNRREDAEKHADPCAATRRAIVRAAAAMAPEAPKEKT